VQQRSHNLEETSEGGLPRSPKDPREPRAFGVPRLALAARAIFATLSALGRAAFASELFSTLGAGSIAGVLIGISDLVRIAANGDGWVGTRIAAAVLGLWLWVGQLFGLGIWLVHCLARQAQLRIPRAEMRRALYAVVVSALAFVLALKLFSGAGVQRTRTGTWGPWLVLVASLPSAWLCLLVGQRATSSRRASLIRRGAALGLGLFGVGVLIFEGRFAGWYLYVHILLLSSALVSIGLSVWLLPLPTLVKGLPFVFSFAALPSLLTFPASLRARTLLVQGGWAGVRVVDYAEFKVDFDHDGHSPWFGGGDCDDTDPNVFVGAPEYAGDGRDSDCDGVDDPTPIRLTFAPFRASATGAVQHIIERARAYPTVVILVDALRFDRVYDSRFPVLAALASESIRFTRSYATSSTTLSSVPAIVTGRVRPKIDRTTIAESLAHVGQRTAFVSVDALQAHLRAGGGQLLRGFSTVEAVPTDYAQGWLPGGSVASSEAISARALSLLDSEAPPDLLWLHYFDVHQWHMLKQSTSGQPIAARYDAAVQLLDAGLRPLFERRDKLNLLLLADHGEALGAHRVDHHGGWVFEEVARIPLLLRVPGIEPASIDVPVTTTGIFNLLRDLRGLEREPDADDSLLDLVGAKDVGNGPGFAEFESNQWSLVYGPYRLLYTTRERLSELYDVVRDPQEQHDLSSQQPALTAQLLARLFQLNNQPPQ
jgi:hypothetical protein